jgi:hypothetical protein
MLSSEAEEELATLEAIYADNVLLDADAETVTVLLGDPVDAALSPALRCHLPGEYPGSIPPVAELLHLDFLASDTHDAMLSMFAPGTRPCYRSGLANRNRLASSSVCR